MSTYPPIALYPTEIAQAWRMDETGPSYSLEPWGANTDRIKGESFAPDRVLILNNNVEVYRGALDDIVFQRPAQREDQTREATVTATAYELISRKGTIMDTLFGSTRPLQSGETPTPVTDLIGS